jgi:CBS domain-containing protein
MNTSIATLLRQKSGAIFTVTDKVNVAEAVQTMITNRVGSVLVLNGSRLAGIFTERDVLRRVVGAGLNPQTTPVTQVMTAEVRTITPATTVQEVMDLFTEKRLRHLPVMEDGQLLGLISIGDVSRWVANTDRAEAESLRQYIAGGLST